MKQYMAKLGVVKDVSDRNAQFIVFVVFLECPKGKSKVANAPVTNTPYYPTPVLYRGIDKSFFPRVGEIDMGY